MQGNDWSGKGTAQIRYASDLQRAVCHRAAMELQ